MEIEANFLFSYRSFSLSTWLKNESTYGQLEIIISRLISTRVCRLSNIHTHAISKLKRDTIKSLNYILICTIPSALLLKF